MLKINKDYVNPDKEDFEICIDWTKTYELGEFDLHKNIINSKYTNKEINNITDDWFI